MAGTGRRKRPQRKGYLRIEGQSWLFSWREYQKDADGGVFCRRRTEALGTRTWAKEHAREQADKILLRVNGSMRPNMRITFREFVAQKFEPQVTSRRPAAGRSHYEYQLRKHILPALGDLQLCDIGPDDVEALITAKQARYEPQTLRHIKYAISAVFEHAAYLRVYLERNPARGVNIPDGATKKRPTYTTGQLARVLIHLKSPIYEMALLSIAASLGNAELCGIRLAHANLTALVRELDGEIIAPYSIAIHENFYKGERGRLKTGARRRIVPITAKLAKSLAALAGRSKKKGPEDPLFQSRNGTPLDTHNIANRIFGPLAKKLGFKVTWYGFRRAHSSLAAITGASLEDRKLVMGHANDRMTRYYDIADVERMRAVPKRILARVRKQELKMKRAELLASRAEARLERKKMNRAEIVVLQAKAG